jgi:dihydrodipicolinate synthase/N-acetylneuraminate lyase
VLSGSDADLVEAFAAGARGLVSGLCCLAPALYVKLADAVERGDQQGVNESGNTIAGLRGLLGDGVGAVKGLRHQGFPVGRPRMAVADPETRGLVTALASMGGVDGAPV